MLGAKPSLRSPFGELLRLLESDVIDGNSGVPLYVIDHVLGDCDRDRFLHREHRAVDDAHALLTFTAPVGQFLERLHVAQIVLAPLPLHCLPPLDCL